MKKHVSIVLAGILFLTIIGVLGMPIRSEACGWGNPGGQGYVPQRRGNAMGPLASKPAITKEQALDIVSNHVNRLNPELKVGQINDAGNFFEAEILSKDNEILQLMGVDKMTGRLMIIN